MNESKSDVIPSDTAVQEQSELDALFEAAREQVFQDILEDVESGYGFQDPWNPIDEPETDESIESEALIKLWAERSNVSIGKRDRLDRFCISAFMRLRSDEAVATVLAELGNRPHLTRTYCTYLEKFIRDDPAIQSALCQFLSGSTFYDSELQWPIAALLALDAIPQDTVAAALGVLKDRARSQELRAACAILIGRFGNGPSKAVLRGHWDEEYSIHVKAAMVLTCMFLGREEKRTLLTHWGSQSPLFAMIAAATRKIP